MTSAMRRTPSGLNSIESRTSRWNSGGWRFGVRDSLAGLSPHRLEHPNSATPGTRRGLQESLGPLCSSSCSDLGVSGLMDGSFVGEHDPPDARRGPGATERDSDQDHSRSRSRNTDHRTVVPVSTAPDSQPDPHGHVATPQPCSLPGPQPKLCANSCADQSRQSCPSSSISSKQWQNRDRHADFENHNGVTPLLSQTATDRWPGGTPWESQPSRRPTGHYEPKPTTPGPTYRSAIHPMMIGAKVRGDPCGGHTEHRLT